VSGIEVTEMITSQYPLCKVIYYTSHVDEEMITRGFEAGAYGYVPKNFKPQELIEAIHMVNDGQKFMKGIVSEKFISSYLKSEKEKKLKQDIPLSEREMEVLKHMSLGLSNKQIADKLFISIRTVETHKHNLMKKLNIYSTAELVIYAIQNNIIKI
ncbi:MAG: response regulator transcription factor, partial [Bacteroidetes bacterium]|nr:response regulator transcription factor [Bacteroidota bacterium]